MRERPILFSGPMVRAILDGRKTQTRRVINPQPKITIRDIGEGCFEVVWHDKKNTINAGGGSSEAGKDILNQTIVPRFIPYGKPGDQLWVREAWCRAVDPITSRLNEKAHYQADGQEVHLDDGDGFATVNKDGSLASPWKPSIHMPRWASRISLEVTKVRVERVREISEEDSKAEGVDQVSMADVKRQAAWSSRQDFANLWDIINAKRGFGWSTNPWVWVVEFKALKLSSV